MLNLAILFGRLVEEPVLSSKENRSDTTIWCPFRLAVGRDRKKEEEADTDFFPCVVFGRSASYLARWGRKGGRILLFGRLRTGTTNNEDGSRSYYTQVVVDRLWVIDSKKDGTGADRYPAYDPAADPGRFAAVMQHDPGVFA